MQQQNVPGTSRLWTFLGALVDRTMTRSGRTLGKEHEVVETVDVESSDELHLGRVGSYRLVDVLGDGGQGRVYRAVHLETNWVRAIKVLIGGQFADERRIRDFIREAQALERVRHRNVVEIKEVFRDRHRRLYCVMELVEGENLRSLLERKGRIPWEEAAQIVRQIISALAAAHAARIIHRDIKPSNVLLANSAPGELLVKVIDFGIAKVTRTEQSTSTNTRGGIVGSFPYLSPEQCRMQPIDVRSDVYSLGILFYELLCGRPPYLGHPATIILQHANEDAPPPPSTYCQESAIPEAIEAVVMKAIAKKRAERFTNMAAFATALDEACGLFAELPERPLVDAAETLNSPILEEREPELVVAPKPAAARVWWVALLLLFTSAAFVLGRSWQPPSQDAVAAPREAKTVLALAGEGAAKVGPETPATAAPKPPTPAPNEEPSIPSGPKEAPESAEPAEPVVQPITPPAESPKPKPRPVSKRAAPPPAKKPLPGCTTWRGLERLVRGCAAKHHDYPRDQVSVRCTLKGDGAVALNPGRLASELKFGKCATRAAAKCHFSKPGNCTGSPVAMNLKH